MRGPFRLKPGPEGSARLARPFPPPDSVACSAAAQAASRRPARNPSTLSNNAAACSLSWPDATMTLSACARDWSAAWLAPATLCETWLVPIAACCTLRAISLVAECCCSTAAAIVAAVALISRMVSLMPPIAVTQLPVAD